MKARVFKISLTILVVFLIFAITTPSSAQKKKSKDLSPEELSGLMLVNLTKKGLIKYWIDEPGFMIQVDPLFWKNQLHRDKEQLVRYGMITSYQLNKQKGMKIDTIMLFDMTTMDKLAVGFIGNISPGKIEIYK